MTNSSTASLNRYRLFYWLFGFVSSIMKISNENDTTVESNNYYNYFQGYEEPIICIFKNYFVFVSIVDCIIYFLKELFVSIFIVDFIIYVCCVVDCITEYFHCLTFIIFVFCLWSWLYHLYFKIFEMELLIILTWILVFVYIDRNSIYLYKLNHLIWILFIYKNWTI